MSLGKTAVAFKSRIVHCPWELEGTSAPQRAGSIEVCPPPGSKRSLAGTIWTLSVPGPNSISFGPIMVFSTSFKSPFQALLNCHKHGRCRLNARVVF